MRRIALTLIALATAAGAAERPNILFLFADDLGRYASAYADPERPSPNDLIETPVFDRIAEQGALFTNAFVSAPSCTPCRGAVYTGRHFFRNGSSSQLHNPWSKGVPDPFAEVAGMPMVLEKGGYHIGWSLKWHTRAELIGGKRNHYAKHGKDINNYSQLVSAADDKEAEKRRILKQVRANFVDFLDAREEGQPFFYSFNPTNTHRSWVAGSGKALWGIDPDELEGRMPPFLPDVPVVREDLADYLGEAMAFDAACGVILDELEKRGESDDTLICISGDHGAPGFPAGKCNVRDFGARVLLAMRMPGKIAAGRTVEVPVSLIDLAPSFLAAAGMESPDDPDGENLLPALAEGGGDSMLRGWALIGREVHVREGRPGGLPYPVRALRTPEHLYVLNFKPERWPMGAPKAITDEHTPSRDELIRNTRIGFADIDGGPTKAWMVEERRRSELEEFTDIAWGKRPREELYILAEDPYQMDNVAMDPEHAGTRKRLSEKLMAELEASDDPRLDDAFDRSPYLPEDWDKKRR